jgi:hypothetical protein
LRLGIYDNAEKYLHDVLHERFDPKKLPPISMWEKELTAKTAERETLYQRYGTTKSETASAEKIRRTVEDILKSETPRETRQKLRGKERYLREKNRRGFPYSAPGVILIRIRNTLNAYDNRATVKP